MKVYKVYSINDGRDIKYFDSMLKAVCYVESFPLCGPDNFRIETIEVH